MVARKTLAQNSNFLFLPELHTLDLFKGQPVRRSSINPGGRRAGMAGGPFAISIVPPEFMYSVTPVARGL
jgi:hypothetical protein